MLALSRCSLMSSLLQLFLQPFPREGIRPREGKLMPSDPASPWSGGRLGELAAAWQGQLVLPAPPHCLPCALTRSCCLLTGAPFKLAPLVGNAFPSSSSFNPGVPHLCPDPFPPRHPLYFSEAPTPNCNCLCWFLMWSVFPLGAGTALLTPRLEDGG